MKAGSTVRFLIDDFVKENSEISPNSSRSASIQRFPIKKRGHFRSQSENIVKIDEKMKNQVKRPKSAKNEKILKIEKRISFDTLNPKQPFSAFNISKSNLISPILSSIIPDQTFERK